MWGLGGMEDGYRMHIPCLWGILQGDAPMCTYPPQTPHLTTACDIPATRNARDVISGENRMFMWEYTRVQPVEWNHAHMAWKRGCPGGAHSASKRSNGGRGWGDSIVYEQNITWISPNMGIPTATGWHARTGDILATRSTREVISGGCIVRRL